MKKLAASLLLASCLCSAAGAAEEISIVLSGRPAGSLAAYRLGPTLYVGARQAASLYGAQLYWYPISGRIQMSLRGKALQFLVNSERVQMGGRSARLEAPVLVRASQALLPLSFLLGEEFSSWAGAETSFNPRTRLLAVDRRSTVGPVRWFSYQGHTRLVLELAPGLSYRSSRRGVGGLEISVPLGTIESSEEAEIEDGLVTLYSLRQGPRVARLSVKFTQGLRWRIRELSSPRRLVLDLFRGDPPAQGSWAREGSPPASSAPVPSPQPRAAQIPVAPEASTVPERSRRRIVIDPGHGGKDGGARGRRGTLEKEINLQAALELARLLKDEGIFEVMLTRAGDIFVPLDDRSRMANEFGADLFISLHCNASPNRRDSGFEAYFLSERASDPQAARLASFENSVLELEGKSVREEEAALILRELVKTENINAAAELAGLIARALSKRVDIPNRGVKQAAFYVLRGTQAPAILFEMAYISNKKEEIKIESKRYRRRLVDGLYAGVLDYAKRQGWVTAPN